MSALRVEGLVVEVAGRRILDDVSLEVGRGEFVCLLGPNGGGKTTLLKAVLGLVPVAQGQVEILGEPAERGRRRVGYLPQRKAYAPLFPARALELIVAARRGELPLRVTPAERDLARAVLARVGGDADLLDRPLAALSGGETQRVFLARALVTEPALLLLDEPTAGVDARGRAEFLTLLEAIARSGTLATLLVTHNQAAVRRLADRAVHLDHRVLAAGHPDEVLALSHGPADGGHDHEADAVCEED